MLHDGWLRTGDIGIMDDDGYFSIVDRVKDIIIAGGLKIFPREVDEAMFEQPQSARGRRRRRAGRISRRNRSRVRRR